MKLEKDELKIFYNVPDGINSELDTAIEELFSKFGYERWASGITLDSNVRDIAFTKEPKQEK